jgi:MFS transporter, ACS family, hexuronate transporter
MDVKVDHVRDFITLVRNENGRGFPIRRDWVKLAPMSAGHKTNFRWVICALLFFATTVNYVDRQILGLLKNDLMVDLGWNEIDYSNVVFAFQFAYAIGLISVGWAIDRLGVRKGYALAVLFWSLAAMAHAACRGVISFGVARFALGLSESGNFPSAIKSVAEWFPKKERALVTGIFNAGTNVGAMVAPLVVPWLTHSYGWRWAFIFTGAIGFLWLVFWLPTYRSPERHPRVNAAELAYIQSDPPDPEVKIPWLKLLPHRQTLAFALGKLMTDPIWWFYLFWIPGFLQTRYKIDLQHIGPPLIAIYIIADVGSIGGGWLSSFLLKRGLSVNRSRKLAMLFCALCVLPILIVPTVKSVWPAALLIGLAAAAHQGWSANIFTLVSDMFPRRAVGSVVGIGGMGGAFGGMIFAKATGYILQGNQQNYMILFFIAGGAYLSALLVIQLLAPNLEPARIEE